MSPGRGFAARNPASKVSVNCGEDGSMGSSQAPPGIPFDPSVVEWKSSTHCQRTVSPSSIVMCAGEKVIPWRVTTWISAAAGDAAQRLAAAERGSGRGILMVVPVGRN